MDRTRASDSERERVVGRLRLATTTGRLTVEELDERSERAYEAVTRGELLALLDDLPEPRRATKRGGRLPWFPGRLRFSARWRGPADARRAGTDVLELLVPVFVRDGYELVERTSDRLVLGRRVGPTLTSLFVIGPLAVLHRRVDRVTIDLVAEDDHTLTIAQGVAPLAIRRGLAELENL